MSQSPNRYAENLEPGPLTPEQNTFLIEEYKSLRAQIQQYTQDLISFEKWALLASGAMWSYLVTSEFAKNLPVFIFYGPMIISVLLGFRSLGVYRSNLRASDYLASIERQLNFTKLGWHANAKRSWTIVWAGVVYWVLLIAINFVVAYIITHHPAMLPGTMK